MAPTLQWKTRSLSAADKLLTAGADLFAGSGYGGTTVEAVARRAGVNKALVSYHFGGKKGLYRAVRDEILHLLPDPGKGPASGPPVSTARIVLADLSRATNRRPLVARWILREALGDGPPPPDGHTVLDRLTEMLASLRPPITGRGAATPDSARQHARAALVMLLDQAVHQAGPAAAGRALDSVATWLEMEPARPAARRRAPAAPGRACLPGRPPDSLL